MAFSQLMIEEIAAWCWQSPELVEARQAAWEEFFAEADPRPVKYWKGAEERNSRERRFLGYFLFDYALADGEKPAALAARRLYSGSVQAEALKAVAGARFVLAMVTSIIRRSVYLELEDESFEVRSPLWAASFQVGLAAVAHLVPVRHGYWLPGPGWMVWPFSLGPGIRSHLRDLQMDPIRTERLLQGRSEAKEEEEKRPEPPRDESLEAAVARMTAWAKEHGYSRLVMSIAEWQALTVRYMLSREHMKFYEDVLGRTGGLESTEELNELAGLTSNIWNNTPQPDRGGLTPNELARRRAGRSPRKDR